MKNRIRFGLCITLTIIFFLNINNVVYARSEINTDSYSKSQHNLVNIKSELIEKYYDLVETNPPTRYPGFLIIQLIKGIIAFIIVLLILFDLIEP